MCTVQLVVCTTCTPDVVPLPEGYVLVRWSPGLLGRTRSAEWHTFFCCSGHLGAQTTVLPRSMGRRFFASHSSSSFRRVSTSVVNSSLKTSSWRGPQVISPHSSALPLSKSLLMRLGDSPTLVLLNCPPSHSQADPNKRPTSSLLNSLQWISVALGQDIKILSTAKRSSPLTTLSQRPACVGPLEGTASLPSPWLTAAWAELTLTAPSTEKPFLTAQDASGSLSFAFCPYTSLFIALTSNSTRRFVV